LVTLLAERLAVADAEELGDFEAAAELGDFEGLASVVRSSSDLLRER